MENLPIGVAVRGVTREIRLEEVTTNQRENRSKEGCSKKKIHPLPLDISVNASSFLQEEERERAGFIRH